MRTTLTINDDIALELKELAHRSGRSFTAVVNETLRAGLTVRRYRLRTEALGTVRQGVNLDKAVALADSIEDEELMRKMELRK